VAAEEGDGGGDVGVDRGREWRLRDVGGNHGVRGGRGRGRSG
jgi:hypothetical protein